MAAKKVKRKNAPGQGRKPNDPRGVTKAKMLYLIPIQAEALEDFAFDKGYSSASRMVGAWIDQGCKGVRRGLDSRGAE